MKNIFSTLITLFLFTNFIFSQKSNLPGKLPWINGNLPANSINYNYKVVIGEGLDLITAQNEAVKELINNLASEKGVRVSSETIMETQTIENNNQQTFSADYKRNTKINQDGFEVTFTRVDEYFEYDKNLANYKVWRLYVIGQSSSNIPKINYSTTYGMSDAGFRSLLVPGWGQFYKKKNTKGLLFLVGAAGSVGGFLYANNQHSYNINRSLETNDIALKKQFVEKAGDFTTMKNLTLGAAAALWVWNVIDATSTEGATKYAQNKPIKLNIVSDKNSSLALNFKYKF